MSKKPNLQETINALDFDTHTATHGSYSAIRTSVVRDALALLKAQKWTSVEDELPPKATWSGDRVLVYTEEGYIHTGKYSGEDKNEWADVFNDSGLITHWMPLPKPPKPTPPGTQSDTKMMYAWTKP